MAAVLSVLVVGQSPAGAATRHHPPHNCQGLRSIRAGTFALFDDHSQKSQLVTKLDRMVCSAANGATIDIKSWFILVDGPYVRRLVNHLKIMHRYHNVRVHVFLGRNWYERKHRLSDYRYFKTVFSPFARIATCRYSCESTVSDGSDHSKWVAVSRLRNGRSAVLSTGMNISTEQFGTGETGILVVGNWHIYNAFVGRWHSYEACAVDTHSRGCRRENTNHQPAVHWYGSAYTGVYFTPGSTDPIATALSNTHCRRGATHHFIQIASIRITRTLIVDQLKRLRSEGCRVHVLSERYGSKVGGLTMRCLKNHDKSLIVDTPKRREVFTGSEDWVWFALHVSDNQTMRTTKASIVHAYEHFYSKLWRRGGSCTAKRALSAEEALG